MLMWRVVVVLLSGDARDHDAASFDVPVQEEAGPQAGSP
jgi:hypothetical protein